MLAIDGVDIRRWDPAVLRRRFAVVFQDYSRSLFPWLTVQRNVEFPLRRGLGHDAVSCRSLLREGRAARQEPRDRCDDDADEGRDPERDHALPVSRRRHP